MITEIQKWLNENRGEYEAAMAKLSDAKFVRGLLTELRAATIGLTAYNPIEHPPHAAVAFLVEARVSLGEIFAELAVMEQYEQYRAMVNEGEEDSNE